MPRNLKKAKKVARKEKRKGHAPTTQSSEFVHQEMREAKKSGRSRKQAIAIGLSEARRSGVKVPAKKKKATKKKTSKKKTSKKK